MCLFAKKEIKIWRGQKKARQNLGEIHCKFSNLTLKIAGETARPINVDNSNTPEGIDHTFFEWMDYLCNSRSDEFDTLLTYKTWINQFKIYAFPISEWYPQKATNTLQFEINFENPPSKDKTTQMHLIMIRANNA